MEQLVLVCIDNIECVVGDEFWEMVIFNFYNWILELGKIWLLIIGDWLLWQLNFGLLDLVLWLDWGQIYKLQLLLDEDKLQVLQLCVRLCGFEMFEDVCCFLLKWLDCEMCLLFMIFDQLDYVLIIVQCKLMIFFVKEIFKFQFVRGVSFCFVSLVNWVIRLCGRLLCSIVIVMCCVFFFCFF